MKTTFESSQAEMKKLIMDQLATVISLLQKQPSQPAEDERRRYNSGSEDDVYPEDWEPNVDEVPSTPTDAIIMAIGDTQSQDVQQLDGPPAGVEFVRRAKRKPVYLKDYTAGKKKQRTGPVEVDTLRPANPRLYKFFKRWITYSRDNCRPREVHTGIADRSWFVKLMVEHEWIDDSQIDAIFHLLRRRRKLFPKVYTTNCVVLDTYAPQIFSMYWNCHDGDRSTFIWDESIIDYVRGKEHRHLPCWENQEYIYFTLNLPAEKHWVAVEVDIENWQIVVYDCDIGATTEDNMKSYLKPYTEIFASLLRASGYFKTNSYVFPVETGDLSQLPPMHYKRATPEVVPQAESSGDCGIYAIEYVEHRMLDLPFEKVNDDNMLTFRHRWCVDLFYQNV
ncbi:uncharacterized protein LOC133806146 [Humulus lupulus]|uniref:uncharacterized protein LOC133806146 n=1 Tax=Humulus lupulus TaxID=3486 RepID=UPI002B40BA87|nr:uncharacterized protein LOC133806146 [Humulus lupulus]